MKAIFPRLLINSALLVAVILVSCGDGEDADPQVHDQSTRSTASAGTGSAPFDLLETDTVIVPDTTQSTEWIGTIRKLAFDRESGHLFGLQPDRGDLIEFATDGTLIRRYGGNLGRGPGEILQLADFALADGRVALLDRGNRRVSVFDRSAHPQAEFMVSPYHRSVAFLGEELVLLPGEAGAALDVYSLTGSRSRSLGNRDDLPVRCSDSECYERNVVCLSCEVKTTSDSRIVMVNREQAIITVMDPDGTIQWSRDFLTEDELLSSWVSADAPLREQMEKEEAARSPSNVRTEVLKSYFLQVEVAGDGLLTFAVVPSASEFQRRGYEVWRLDPRDGTYERFQYPRRGVGFLAAGTPAQGVFGVDPRGGGIYRFGVAAR